MENVGMNRIVLKRIGVVYSKRNECTFLTLLTKIFNEN